MTRNAPISFVLAPLLISAMALLVPRLLLADQVILSNGTILEGEAVGIKALDEPDPVDLTNDTLPNPDRLLLIDQEYRRYFVSLRLKPEEIEEQEIVSYDIFELPQKKVSSGGARLSVGLPRRLTPFDDHGVRTMTLNGVGNRPIDVIQGITRITPKYVTVEGVNQKWWQGLSLSEFSDHDLQRLIYNAIDDKDPDDRLSVARFLVKSGRYETAAKELDAISQEFPELETQTKESLRELNQLRANWLLTEVEHRRDIGQHQLAMNIINAFPTGDDFNAEIIDRVTQIRREYQDGFAKVDQILVLLGELESQLDSDPERSKAAEIRRTVAGGFTWETLSRFDAFLNLAADGSLPPGDRLALAYSGWMLGSANAITDLPQTFRIWDARSLVAEYFHTQDPAIRSDLLTQLTRIESVDSEVISKLLPLMPPVFDSSTRSATDVEIVETRDVVHGWGEGDQNVPTLLNDAAGRVSYAVVLPPEYSPSRFYPLVVALRPAEWDIERTARFWGARKTQDGSSRIGPATQEGYIVIAPQYADDKQVTYNYSAREHMAILASIRDAKFKFQIDSDRVFVVGHGMGGDATFDIALSQPDLFAGAAPISGLFGRSILFEKQSPPMVPFYIVNGELDRNARVTHGDDIAYMMNRGHDIIYCEYVGRGYEYYSSEVELILEWMNRLRRVDDPIEVTAQVARTSDLSHYWVSTRKIPPRNLIGRPTQNGIQLNPMSFEAKFLQGTKDNSIVLSSGAGEHIFKLNRELIDFDKRLRVRKDGRQVFNDFVEPDVSHLLENFEETGDRQKLYPIRIRVE